MIVATFEPGLACMLTATDDGGMKRIQAGNLVVEAAAAIGSSVDLALPLPFFAEAIFVFKSLTDLYNSKLMEHKRMVHLISF